MLCSLQFFKNNFQIKRIKVKSGLVLLLHVTAVQGRKVRQFLHLHLVVEGRHCLQETVLALSLLCTLKITLPHKKKGKKGQMCGSVASRQEKSKQRDPMTQRV